MEKKLIDLDIIKTTFCTRLQNVFFNIKAKMGQDKYIDMKI